MTVRELPELKKKRGRHVWDSQLKGDLFGADNIRQVHPSNPKRPGTRAHEIFSLYRDAQTVDEFVLAVGNRSEALSNIRYDVGHGYIILECDDSTTGTTPVQPSLKSLPHAGGEPPIGHTLSPAIRAMFIDPTSWWAQHLAEITEQYLADLGGDEVCTTAEKAVIRKVGVLEIEMRRIEAYLATDPDPSAMKIEMYTRLAKTFHQLLNMTGLERRRPKTIVPTLEEYMHREAAE
ncbi:MAG: hypothetical protein AAAB35_24860 [Phyllobacterium sp.]|uniref:hypothetical protein n=1 Tax=Phyllobacterium sp. TaxID=1871046 RepID=UPI0030F0C4C5